MWLAETHYPVGDAFPAVIVPEVVLLLAACPRDDFIPDSQQAFYHLTEQKQHFFLLHNLPF